MKRLRKTLLALFAGLSTAAMADDYAYLTVEQQDGQTSFSVSEISTITFDAAYMNVKLSDGTTQQLPLSALSKMYFSDNGLSAISPASVRETQIRLLNGVVHVTAQPGTPITLYNIGGQVVQQMTAQGDDTQMNVGTLRQGVYIVKVGTTTKKIMNR